MAPGGLQQSLATRRIGDRDAGRFAERIVRSPERGARAHREQRAARLA
jgi:hypothetical protein